MSMAPSCRKLCSNSSPGGLITDPLLASAMQAAVSKTHPSVAFRSRIYRSIKLDQESMFKKERVVHRDHCPFCVYVLR